VAGAPCHTLLTSLANMNEEAAAAAGGSGPSSATAPPGAAQHRRHPDAPEPVEAPGAGAEALPPRIPLRAVSLQRGASSEALEVLSSQFGFSGACSGASSHDAAHA